MRKQLSEIQLRSIIRKMIKEQSDPKMLHHSRRIKEELEAAPKAEGPQSWFTVVNIVRILQNKLARVLANDKDVKLEFSTLLSDLIRKRYTYPEVQSLMSFIEKYK